MRMLALEALKMKIVLFVNSIDPGEAARHGPPHLSLHCLLPGSEVIKLFSCSTRLNMKFFLLINVKMPTIVGILTFVSGKNSVIGLSEPKKLNFLMFLYLGAFKFELSMKKVLYPRCHVFEVSVFCIAQAQVKKCVLQNFFQIRRC